MSKPPYLLTTPRLGLRTWHETDLEHYARLNSDPEVMRFYPSIYPHEKSRASMLRQIEHQKQHGFCFWATDLLETDAFIGFVGLSIPLFEAHFTPCVEIGWRIDKQHWGKGLAPEGARACLEYARDQPGIDEVYSFTPLSNHPSERVMQKIGMQKIGTFQHPLIEDGHPLKEHLLYHIRLTDEA